MLSIADIEPNRPASDFVEVYRPVAPIMEAPTVGERALYLLNDFKVDEPDISLGREEEQEFRAALYGCVKDAFLDELSEEITGETQATVDLSSLYPGVAATVYALAEAGRSDLSAMLEVTQSVERLEAQGTDDLTAVALIAIRDGFRQHAITKNENELVNDPERLSDVKDEIANQCIKWLNWHPDNREQTKARWEREKRRREVGYGPTHSTSISDKDETLERSLQYALERAKTDEQREEMLRIANDYLTFILSIRVINGGDRNRPILLRSTPLPEFSFAPGEMYKMGIWRDGSELIVPNDLYFTRGETGIFWGGMLCSALGNKLDISNVSDTPVAIDHKNDKDRYGE